MEMVSINWFITDTVVVFADQFINKWFMDMVSINRQFLQLLEGILVSQNFFSWGAVDYGVLTNWQSSLYKLGEKLICLEALQFIKVGLL
jgi:hypothetical protein